MDVELAWFAGLFEGEGTVTWDKRYHTMRLSVGSTDLDVLERVQQATGVGTISGPYKGQGKSTPEHYKPMYGWYLSNHQDQLDLWEKIRPMMSARRSARFDELCAMYDAAPRKRRPDSKRTRPSTRGGRHALSCQPS